MSDGLSVSQAEVDKRLKLRDDVPDKTRELLERFDQRITLNNLRLAERYIKSEILFLVHFGSTKGGESVAYLQRAFPITDLVEDVEGRRQRSCDTHVLPALLHVPCHGRTEVNAAERACPGD